MSLAGREADVDAPAAASVPAARATVAPLPALRGRCVLVVDDSVPVARSTAKLLELFGAVAVTAHSGADALRRLELADFDLLVVDLGLPDLDGREVLRRARQRRPAQAALFVSGLPCDDALPAGVLLVAKPFQLATLLAAVEGALA